MEFTGLKQIITEKTGMGWVEVGDFLFTLFFLIDFYLVSMEKPIGQKWKIKRKTKQRRKTFRLKQELRENS